MKTYIENFKKYRFLLVELVKKGIKLKYRYSLDFIGTASYHDCFNDRVWVYVWKSGPNISCVHPDRKIVVQLFFFSNQWGNEIHKRKCRDDKKSICSKIYLSFVQRII